MTDDSHATSADSMIVCSAPAPRTVVSVACSNAVSQSARSIRLPMSIIVQPTSRTIDSPATPANVSIPASVCDWADASNASASVSESGGSARSAIARSTPASTIQVSLDSWSRTARAASARPSTDWTRDPGRSGSTVSDHSVDGATAIISAWSASVPVSVPVIRPSAAISTGTHSLSSVSWWCR